LPSVACVMMTFLGTEKIRGVPWYEHLISKFKIWILMRISHHDHKSKGDEEALSGKEI
jgi:hypothetical protein